MGCCQSGVIQQMKQHVGFKEIKHRSLGELLAHTDKSYKGEDWGELVSLTFNTTEIPPQSHSLWSESPSTIGCLAISYLAMKGQESPKLVASYINNIIPLLLSSIKLGTNDLRENSLILLAVYVESSSDTSIAKLLELNVFQILLRFFMCSKLEVRMLSTHICALIYKNRDYAVETFLNAKGEKILLQVVTWSISSEELFLKTLMHLEHLILDQDERSRKSVCLRINMMMGWDILKSLEISHFSQATQDQLDYLLSLISYSNF